VIIIIDNYDSFVYNLYQRLGIMHPDIQVWRNDRITCSEIEDLSPDYLVISPGPGTPENAGISVEAVDYFKDKIPILGVCLGHQAIALAFGGRIFKAREIVHGKTCRIEHNSKNLFAGMPNSFTAARYHSLVVEACSLPACLRVTAQSHDGVIMAICHAEYPVFGVQFHPESYLTECWDILLANFLACGNSK